MKLIFMGTPEFAAVSLRALARLHRVEAAFCMPDRPAGRGGAVSPPAVKLAAAEFGIPVFQPENAGLLEGELKRFQPDAVCVVAYGLILPPSVLSLFPGRFINLHASLLPAYRGAAPINRAVMAGETKTGLTTMLISGELDAGDILLSCEIQIGDDDSAEDLLPVMAERGSELLLETLRAVEAGTVSPRPQDHSAATLAPALAKEDGRIDWTKPARDICNRIRGTAPWPGAFTSTGGGTLKIIRARFRRGEGEPGEILSCEKTLVIAAGRDAVEATEVQAEGKRRMPAGDFLRGARLKTGDIMGRS